MTDILYKLEFEIENKTKASIANLLQTTFSDFNFAGRTYYKQLPHSRFLAFIDDEFIGNLSIDYRVMNLNNEAVKVIGISDLCVSIHHRGKGISKKLMLALENLASKNSTNVDFIFLATDIPQYYSNLGYHKIENIISWLKIDQHKNYGIGKELITDTNFMIKEIGQKKWKNGSLDMLGFMY